MYEIKKTDTEWRLCNIDGSPLVLFSRREPNMFEITYCNDVIDNEDLLINAEKNYGHVHKAMGSCDNEIEQILCMDYFEKLASDGLIDGVHGAIGMDLGDLERISFLSTAGKYYYGASTKDKPLSTVVKELNHKIANTFNANKAVILICTPRSPEFNEAIDQLTVFSDKEIVVQWFPYDGTSDCINVWAFSGNNAK